MVLSGDEAPGSSPVQRAEESEKHENEEFDEDNLKMLKAQQQLCDKVDSNLSNGIHTEDSEGKTQGNGVHEADEHDEEVRGETPKPVPDSNVFSSLEELEDGDGNEVESPPAKRAKCDPDVATDEQHEQESPVPDDLQTDQRIRAAQAQAAVSSPQHKMSNIMNNPSLLAVQQQLQRAAAAGIRKPGMEPFFGVTLPGNTLRSALMPSGSAIGNRLMSPTQTPSAQRTPSTSSVASSSHGGGNVCEICDQNVRDRDRYLMHLQLFHKQMRGKSSADMQQRATLACPRCRDRFWTYEGIERHLVMAHGVVTPDLLTKAQKKEDGGRCKLCGMEYAFNMLLHLVTDHQVKLCSAEIMFSCDVCSFKCSSYNKMEVHLNTVHPKNPAVSAGNLTINTPLPERMGRDDDTDTITLDDD